MTDDKPSEGFRTGWEPHDEDDHRILCSVCGERFDMRKPDNIGKHLHDASGVEFVETSGRRRGRCNCMGNRAFPPSFINNGGVRGTSSMEAAWITNWKDRTAKEKSDLQASFARAVVASGF